ncbi:uncharacterized protein IUM83_11387 [Phytophthora cinnamomi]|uniref:uncharacterized protein n=1 Tax=Phytophthora cinnamomi TaxID=4785 RepID=UPI003559EE72|nr:hypothetical protein IUM83_11387 [Phytophthora cinnamomi]
MTTPSGKRPVPLAVTSITRSSHVSRRQEEAEQLRRQQTQHTTRTIQEELQHIRDSWPYCWNKREDGKQQDATAGMLARLRSRSRSPSPDGRRSRPGRHGGGSLSART